MPHRTNASIALAAIAACLALTGAQLAPAALAQSGNSFQQLATPQTQPPTTTVAPTPSPTTSNSSNGGLSTLAQLAIVAAAIALIAAIAFVIMRDARRVAPVKARDVAVAGDRPGAGRGDRLRRQRARAKQARKARKRNKRAR